MAHLRVYTFLVAEEDETPATLDTDGVVLEAYDYAYERPDYACRAYAAVKDTAVEQEP